MFVMTPFIGISYSEYLVEKLSIFTCYESMINLHSARTTHLHFCSSQFRR